MYFISYDLGTGGVKASLYDRDLHRLPSALSSTRPTILQTGGMSNVPRTGGAAFAGVLICCSHKPV